MNKPIRMLALLPVIGLMLCCLSGCGASQDTATADEKAPSADMTTDAPTTATATETPTIPSSYLIEDVEVIPQKDLKAGCETYACTMLLKIWGFDLDEYYFADNYVEVRWPYYDEEGNMYAADMYSSSVGSPYSGWGVYAPAMARYMNRYLDDEGSDLNAYWYEDIPLSQLCEDYVVNDIPVMVWATTAMLEPYVFDTWEVNYVDENAKTEIGDEFSWLEHEHCLVLIGYDEENYYFADSYAETVSVYEKELCQTRYEQLFSQCIVVM